MPWQRRASASSLCAEEASVKLFELAIYVRSKEAASVNRRGRGYEYNEVVGWVVLEARPKAIRAEYFFVRERPSKVLVRKEFELKGKLFQVPLEGEGTYLRIRSALREWQESSFLSRYYFDLEAFEAVGPFIDWSAVIAASAHNHRLEPTSGTLTRPSAAQPERYAV
jgi:hypothetical protein